METNPKSLESNLKPLKPYPSWFFHNQHSYLLKNKSLGAPTPPNKLGVFPFFLLVHWPPILKHLNVSYTKSSSKWIWSKNMVKPTLIKVSV